MHKLVQLIHSDEFDAFNKGHSVCEHPLWIRGVLTRRITKLTWAGVLMTNRMTLILAEDVPLC